MTKKAFVTGANGFMGRALEVFEAVIHTGVESAMNRYNNDKSIS